MKEIQEMNITPEFLTLARYVVSVVYGVGISMACAVILGSVAVSKVGVDAVRPVLHLVTEGDALRMITVIFIVSAASGLVVLGKIDGGHGATILSGVAGYVLGSGTKGKPATAKQGEVDRK